MTSKYRLLAEDELLQPDDWYMYTDLPLRRHSISVWANEHLTVAKLKWRMNPQYVHLVVVGRNLKCTIKGNKLYA